MQGYFTHHVCVYLRFTARVAGTAPQPMCANDKYWSTKSHIQMERTVAWFMRCPTTEKSERKHDDGCMFNHFLVMFAVFIRQRCTLNVRLKKWNLTITIRLIMRSGAAQFGATRPRRQCGQHDSAEPNSIVSSSNSSSNRLDHEWSMHAHTSACMCMLCKCGGNG